MAQAHPTRLPYPRRPTERLGEVVVGAALIVFALPLMVLVALAIKCESRGPIISRQQRLGAGGRPFIAFKFRGTLQRGELRPGAVWRAGVDRPITRVGSFLRYTRMENLPQLVNVLRGEMSCIHPRSEYPFFLD
jgi:lipopolysaccharide/colanic/teichoic acid biosynthesis glycosyltransferase